MSSAVSKDSSIKWTAPRSVWTLAAQLFYSLLAMLPMYYYLKNILGLVQTDNELLLYIIPIVTGILLFFAMILINEYFWVREKILLKRDITTAAVKSSFLIMVLFYFSYLFFLGYFINGQNPDYLGPLGEVLLEKVMFELTIGLGITIGTAVAMLSIQRYRPTRVK